VQLRHLQAPRAAWRRAAVEVVTVRILTGDALTILRSMSDEQINCVVTSPPYFGLRDYGVAGQLGLEATPVEYVEAMVGVFREVRRVLRSDGTLWLNIGDCYGRGNGIKRKDLVGIPWRVAFALQADGWCLRSMGIRLPQEATVSSLPTRKRGAGWLARSRPPRPSPGRPRTRPARETGGA
jgi:hypothetical protein